MSPVEISGTISGFGQQVLSGRNTEDRTRIGTSSRIVTADKCFDHMRLGATSTGVTTNPASGFGKQTPSAKESAPSYMFGNKYQSDLNMTKEGRPGPGSYEATQAVGKQIQSQKPSHPTWKVGSGGRWSTFNNVWKQDFQTPAAQEYRPASGWLGDAPKPSFHGTARRSTVNNGLPGNTPTNFYDPGPGTYESPVAMGSQHISTKTTSARTRIGTADRNKILHTQYINTELETHLLGKHSPAPNVYNTTPCLPKTSRVPTPQSFRFGSGDRFSQVIPRDQLKRTARLPGPEMPGPGTYVI